MEKYISGRKVVSFLLIVLLLAGTFMPHGFFGTKTGTIENAYAGEVRAMGDNEWFKSVSGGVSPFNVDTSWIHHRSDGALAYCRQKGLNNPDGTVGTYYINSWEPGEESKMQALFANADSVAASYGISGDYTRALIQMTIWSVQHDYDSFNPAPGSVTSSSPAILSAFHALYSAAEAGYSQTTASINGLKDGAVLTAQANGKERVRYGPFSVSGSTGASANFANAPKGSFFGDERGNAVNGNNIANGQVFYLYVPFGEGFTTVPSITIKASYSVVSVAKYNGFWGYQDQIVGGGFSNAEISATGRLYGFGKATLWKHDDEDGASALSGAVFEIDVWSKAAGAFKASGVQTSWNETNRRYETGTLIETADNEGRFKIKETAAPYSYLSGWSEEVSVKSQYGTQFSINATDTPVKLRINLVKHDRNTGKNVPQGDAKLSGAKYGLYMNETREHPNGTVYEQDQKIAEADTNDEGNIVFENLFPAKYYIKELSPSEGYLLDETVYEVDGTHDGVSKAVERNARASEQVMKQKFELIKIGTSEQETEVTLLGAGFKVYLISELSKVKDGSMRPGSGEWSYKDFKGYDFSSEETAMIDGVRTKELFTDSLGHLISPEFPYGKYVVIESTTPDGYMTINPFIVAITEDSRIAQPWRIFDDKEMRYYIRVIKRDADTGNTVLNKTAKYRIFDLDKNEYIRMKTTYPKVVWYGTEDNPFQTDETGMLITPEKLRFGKYRLDEIKAPEGYVLSGHEKTPVDGYNPSGLEEAKKNDPLYIEFGGNTPVYLKNMEDDVLEVVQFNSQQKGRISLEKKGELPKDAATERSGSLNFRYEQMPLENVSFEIISDGDIVSQDGSGNILYKDGETVEKIVTDKDGRAWSGDLFIGNYILREVAAPEGCLFVLDEYFNITEMDQEIHYTYKDWSLLDGRQKLDIQIIKTEKGLQKPLKDAEFTLYAADNISFGKVEEKNGESKVEGMLRALKDAVFGERISFISKDTAVRKVTTDEKGIAVFSDLPPGKYYVLETKAPKGYLINKDFRAEFSLDFDGNRTNERVVFSESAEDVKQKLNIEIIKEDATSGTKLNGAEFTLYDALGKKVTAAVSGRDGIARFKDISEGRYFVKETKAPQGYAVNTEFKAVFNLEYDQDGAEVLIWKASCKNSKTPYTPNSNGTAGSVPKTGDGFSLLPLVLALLLSASLIAVFAGRFRKTKKAKV